MKHEWKKAEKEFYLPGTKPELINIPSFRFFSIEGKGNPNDKFFAEYIGSYDDAPASFKKMEDFCIKNNFIRESKRHREIYLSDARKVSPDKLKTVLRFKIILP